jgi:hypothetical protein
VRNGGNSAGQAKDDHLKQPLGIGQVLEPVLAEIAQPDPGRQVVAEQLTGRLGQQGLASMSSRAYESRAMNVQAGIVLGDNDQLAVWMPIRIRSATPSGHGWAASARCAATAAATASLAMPKATKNPSPSVPTS